MKSYSLRVFETHKRIRGNSMKRYFRSFQLLSFAVLLSMLLILSRVDTAQSVRAQDATGTQAPTAEPTSVEITDLGQEIVSKHNWKIAYVLPGHEKEVLAVPWWQAVFKGVNQGAKDFAVTVQNLYPDCIENDANSDCVQAQIAILAGLLQSKSVDGIIVRPRDLSRLVPIVEKLQQAGIPVITDEEINTDNVVSKVGFDEIAMGIMLGKWVVQHAPAGAN